MKERPILMSGPMVRAIQADTKWQTRRGLKVQDGIITVVTDGGKFRNVAIGMGESARWLPCPYGVPGDRLWVKETFFDVMPYRSALLFAAVQADYIYRADFDYRELSRRVIGCHHWRPSIFMTRKASRHLLEIVGVRVERLNDISEADAKAEGVTPTEFVIECERGNATIQCDVPPRIGDTLVILGKINRTVPCYRKAYVRLWESINGVGSWTANPWVWVVEFRRVLS